IDESPFGKVYKATWENSTIVLKSITIDTSQIDSEIIGEIKHAINTDNITPIETTINNKTIITNAIKLFINELRKLAAVDKHRHPNIIQFYGVTNELKIMRLSLIDDQMDSQEKWIERKIIEGRINEHKMDEFEDYKFINSGAFSQVYKARFKSTKNICALKIIEKNNHTNKEILNEDPATLPDRIKNGLRENPIADTHHEYVAIYKRCWRNMPDDRPSIEEVALAFEDFIFQGITDNESFDLSDISEFEEFIKNTFESIKDNNIKLNAMVDEMTLLVDNLYSTFSKLFNEGRSVRDIIINFISKSDKTNEEVFQWLLTNNSHSKYICLLGLFYRWKIGIDENSVATLNLFSDAARRGDAIAQYFVGRCYAEGWNTNRDTKEAIKWYKKAADNECAVAEHMLGEYYYKLRRYTNAFYYLKRATENGNIKALNTLGLCYQKGQGTNTNLIEGFRSFEKAALWGLTTSQYELGNCFEYGVGTQINLEKALYWYQKATEVNPNYKIHLTRTEIKIRNH
ncbi:17722_t:CDS:2, partial [Dentiscutata erythropus]